MTYNPKFRRKFGNIGPEDESRRAFTFRMPLEKKRKAYELAKKRRISLSRLVETLLDDYWDFQRR